MSDRRLLLFGASGRTGRHLASAALSAGWTVTAALRDPERRHLLPAEVGVVDCDVLSRDAVARAVAHVRPDAVVSTLGGRGDLSVDDVGIGHLVEACVVADRRRLVVVTSLGCGGSSAHASPRLLAAIGEVLTAKTRGESHVVASDLDWTIVRPGGLLDEAATGKAVLVEDEAAHGRIACADLARLLLDLVDERSSIRRVLSAIDPSLAAATRPDVSPPSAHTRGDAP